MYSGDRSCAYVCALFSYQLPQTTSKTVFAQRFSVIRENGPNSKYLYIYTTARVGLLTKLRQKGGEEPYKHKTDRRVRGGGQATGDIDRDREQDQGGKRELFELGKFNVKSFKFAHQTYI